MRNHFLADRHVAFQCQLPAAGGDSASSLCYGLVVGTRAGERGCRCVCLLRSVQHLDTFHAFPLCLSL